MKSGNLNFLEPSGPLLACNGTTLHFFNLKVAYEGTEVQLLELLASALVRVKLLFYASATFPKWKHTHSKGNRPALACPKVLVK